MKYETVSKMVIAIKPQKFKTLSIIPKNVSTSTSTKTNIEVMDKDIIVYPATRSAGLEKIAPLLFEDGRRIPNFNEILEMYANKANLNMKNEFYVFTTNNVDNYYLNFKNGKVKFKYDKKVNIRLVRTIN
jgi:hypothetical protein